MKIQKEYFTHYASFYGIPCYWNSETEELCGQNYLYDNLLLGISYVIQFYTFFLSLFTEDVNDNFKIVIKEKIDPCCK